MSCALGTCTDPDCYLCQTVAKLPQPVAREASRLRESNSARDGVATKKWRDPIFAPRKRKPL